MADKQTPTHDFAAELKQEMETADFPTLLKHFNTSKCVEDAYNVAGWMYYRFHDEARALLPLMKDDQLNASHETGVDALPKQWAAALTAAKWMRGDATLTSISHTTESQVHEYAQRIFDEYKQKPATTPAKPKTYNGPH